MLQMISTAATPLLADDEGPAAELLNPHGRSPVILVCEHASNFVPAALDGLGLDDAARVSHAAWDIGALTLARRLNTALDAPLVASRVSRLVYDCNRPPEDAGAVPEKSELIEVPGNRGLGPSELAARTRDVYLPFRNLLSRTIETRALPMSIVTIHSFTPVYFGKKRDVELGILHDRDDRMARMMMRAAPKHSSLRTALNEPYAAIDGVTHTLREHAIPRGLPNVMIEVRNDLLGDDAGIARVATDLTAMLESAISEFGQDETDGSGIAGPFRQRGAT